MNAGKASEKRMRRVTGRTAAGQSMAELALVLPLFLIMVFAIVEIGRAFAVKQALTIAAREGARVLVLPYGAGLTYTSENAVQTAAIDRVRSYLASAGVSTGSETVIKVARISPGSDGIYGNGDDPAPELDYIQGIRGQRVGILINHDFETPMPIIVRMFQDPNAQNPGSPQTGITMGGTCYMDHE